MSSPSFLPPHVLPEHAVPALRQQGFAVLGAASAQALLGLSDVSATHMAEQWSNLPPDLYLKDGGRYRRRRHGSYVVDGTQLLPVPHRAHWQPLEYNALHGGMQRWFEPLLPELTLTPDWATLLVRLAALASELRGVRPWFVEAHQFRIDTTDGIGRPTPEGAHRDGVDLVAVFMVGRHHIKGGESRVFDAEGPNGQRFTLTEPWSLLLLDDQRVIHESTPIQPLLPDGLGWRDTLVITLRSGAFQDDASGAASAPGD